VPGNPTEPSNRRISLIVQYIVKDDDEAPVQVPEGKSEAKPESTPEAKTEAKGEENQESQHK
jgi:hypothetical protein